MIERLLELSKRTDDRLLVVEGDRAFVLLPLERYEELLGVRAGAVQAPAFRGSEFPADLDRVNKEIAFARPSAHEGINRIFDEIEAKEPAGEETFYLEPVE